VQQRDFPDDPPIFGPLNYSTDWALGGPIIEREGISVEALHGRIMGRTRIEGPAVCSRWPNPIGSRHALLCCKQIWVILKWRFQMNWLKDFFFCNTWRELFVAIVVGATGLFIFWFLIVAVFVLFG
jgi:hypothetical protein